MATLKRITFVLLGARPPRPQLGPVTLAIAVMRAAHGEGR
jgi:hypothetical protein